MRNTICMIPFMCHFKNLKPLSESIVSNILASNVYIMNGDVHTYLLMCHENGICGRSFRTRCLQILFNPDENNCQRKSIKN